MSLLPIPFSNFVPKTLREDLDKSGQAFLDWLDSRYSELEQEVRELYFLTLPERCPDKFLNDLGLLINSGIITGDSPRIKRHKIKTAIQTHKIRGSWEWDAKNKIDSISGYDARIFSSPGQDDWILVGDASVPASYYYSALGADGIDEDLGIGLIGRGDEIYVSGNIYIDCHFGVYTPVLTPEILDNIENQIKTDVVPAYMRIVLGYLDSLGNFIEYRRIE